MDHLKKEYRFAFDLVTLVMQSYASEWKTYNLLSKSSVENTCFTENISTAVKRILDGPTAYTASHAFDCWFKNQQINLTNIKELMQKVTIDFCMERYNPIKFLEICSFISELSALGYIYGVSGAPQYAIFCITHILSYFKKNGKFSDFSWLELDKYAQDMGFDD
ncbi:hypothetical protein AVEN_70247-1 [Araneus ventricosus]|uniref:Uncharacterized protein n=1 Tax=Araneus ventricosus TaxID=182803 RepID=A0A4Y2GF25_ARAVE|nr:hypothetical protein AVEN_70247-1 [Araneus ventricosus]